MTTTEPGRLLVERRTAFVHLSVRVDGDGFHWDRAAGPARPGPLTCADPELLDLLPDTTASGAAFVLPTVRHPGLSFRTRGPGSLLAAVAAPGGQRTVTEALAATGRALRAVHAVPVPAAITAAPPPGPARLARWLAGAAAPSTAARLRGELTARLGAQRVWTLQQWTGAALTRGPALVHGGPSLGQIVPPHDGTGTVAVLTGEDVTAGHPGTDLGWLLGELVELGRDRTRGWVAPAARALVGGYSQGPVGGPVGPPRGTARCCALRMATHLHDYAAYVGWSDDLVDRLDTVAELVDDPDAVLVHLLAAGPDPQE